MAFVITHGPPLENLKDMVPSLLDIDAFINQPGHATLVNVIINRNKETIMENFHRDKIGAFDFGRPPPLCWKYKRSN